MWCFQLYGAQSISFDSFNNYFPQSTNRLEEFGSDQIRVSIVHITIVNQNTFITFYFFRPDLKVCMLYA